MTTSTHEVSSGATQRPLEADSGSVQALVALLDLLTEGWRTLVGLTLGFAFAGAVFTLIVRPKYEIHAAFLGDTGSQSGLNLSAGLGAIASSLGINANFGQIPPDFYGDLVSSRTVLEPVVHRLYPRDPRMHSRPGIANLLDLMKAKGDNDEERLERFLKDFKKDLNVDVDKITGVVSVDLTTPWPVLGQAVVHEIVRQVDYFNQQVRRRSSQETHRFTEQRLLVVGAQLRGAEDSLRSFYERNRTWQGSPALVVEEGRLRRDIDLQQAVYTTLATQAEQTAMDEVKDTPVLTVVAEPFAPEVRTFPRRKLLTVLASFAGMFVGIGWLAYRNWWSRAARAEPAIPAKVGILVQDVRSEISAVRSRWPFRRVRQGNG